MVGGVNCSSAEKANIYVILFIYFLTIMLSESNFLVSIWVIKIMATIRYNTRTTFDIFANGFELNFGRMLGSEINEWFYLKLIYIQLFDEKYYIESKILDFTKFLPRGIFLPGGTFFGIIWVLRLKANCKWGRVLDILNIL